MLRKTAIGTGLGLVLLALGSLLWALWQAATGRPPTWSLGVFVLAYLLALGWGIAVGQVRREPATVHHRSCPECSAARPESVLYGFCIRCGSLRVGRVRHT